MCNSDSKLHDLITYIYDLIIYTYSMQLKVHKYTPRACASLNINKTESTCFLTCHIHETIVFIRHDSALKEMIYVVYGGLFSKGMVQEYIRERLPRGAGLGASHGQPYGLQGFICCVRFVTLRQIAARSGTLCSCLTHSHACYCSGVLEVDAGFATEEVHFDRGGKMMAGTLFLTIPLCICAL
jgi:hypothetical protein